MINPFRRAAEVARREATEAEVKASRLGVTADDLARAAEVARLAKLAEASREVLEARDRAAEADRREQARDEAVAAHAAAVEREADRIAGTTTVLEASRKRLTGAVKAADKSLAALVAAGVEHDVLVQQSAGELRAAGLVADYRDADERVEFDTGGTPTDGLVLAGLWWTRISPVGLAWRAVYGALCGHLGTEWPGSREGPLPPRGAAAPAVRWPAGRLPAARAAPAGPVVAGPARGGIRSVRARPAGSARRLRQPARGLRA